MAYALALTITNLLHALHTKYSLIQNAEIAIPVMLALDIVYMRLQRYYNDKMRLLTKAPTCLTYV